MEANDGTHNLSQVPVLRHHLRAWRTGLSCCGKALSSCLDGGPESNAGYTSVVTGVIKPWEAMTPTEPLISPSFTSPSTIMRSDSSSSGFRFIAPLLAVTSELTDGYRYQTWWSKSATAWFISFSRHLKVVAWMRSFVFWMSRMMLGLKVRPHSAHFIWLQTLPGCVI